jgi:hypothetical protein
VVSLAPTVGMGWAVTERDHAPHERRRDDDGQAAAAVSTLVGEQLRAARAEVFRAYLQSRDKAQALADEQDDGRHRRVS